MNPTDYMLIEVEEREIHMPELVESHEAAHQAMLDRLMEVAGYTQEDIDNAEPWQNNPGAFILDDDDFFADDWAACEKYGKNYDWKIVRVSDLLDE